MPLKLYNEVSRYTPFMPQVNQLPIFCVPGILGFSKDFGNISSEIYQGSMQQREIYLYSDERNEGLPQDTAVTFTLEDRCKIIADEIINTISENHNLPGTLSSFRMMLAGYSLGGTWLPIISSYIKQTYPNAAITLVIIDGAAPQCVRELLLSNSLTANQYCIAVANYAAQEAGYTHFISNHDASQLQKKDTLTEKFAELALLLSKANPHINQNEVLNRFKRYMVIIKNDLTQAIIKRNDTLPDVEAIHLIATQKTQKDYQNMYLGWPQDKTSFKGTRIAQYEHTQLVSDKTAANIRSSIVTLANDIIEKEVLKSIEESKEMNERFFPLSDDDLSDEQSLSDSTNPGTPSSPIDIPRSEPSSTSSSEASSYSDEEMVGSPNKPSAFANLSMFYTPTVNDPMIMTPPEPFLRKSHPQSQ